jgi:hypothetical protein
MVEMDVDGSVDVLRALLDGDFETYQRLHEGLDPSQRPAFSVVLTAAFNEAAVHRFGDEPDIDGIVAFVAEARARYPRTAQSVKAEDAEKLIRAALGEDQLLTEVSGQVRGSAQTALLFALMHETDTSADRIDGLLSEAGEQAKAYFRRKNGT